MPAVIPSRPTFDRWLKQHTQRTGPIGALAYDASDDPNMPRSKKYQTYLKYFCEDNNWSHLRSTLFAAWLEYQPGKLATPDTVHPATYYFVYYLSGGDLWEVDEMYRRLASTFPIYGITDVEYGEMLERQHYACGMCRRQPDWYLGINNRMPFAIDHDHTTGEVRGLLCTRCNLALGHLGDTLESARAAVAYLVREPYLDPDPTTTGIMEEAPFLYVSALGELTHGERLEYLPQHIKEDLRARGLYDDYASMNDRQSALAGSVDCYAEKGE